MMNMPDECCGLEDVRHEIDRLDREVIGLLSRRLGYVLAAARFKKDEGDIPAPERVKAMLMERRTWAKEYGLSETFVEKLFEQITTWYIATQIAHWREMHRQGTVTDHA
ncbi:isochorismate lyase [uncultured Desulfovibrio sp.]|uniref:isochorismate lyase n=1 Tax=uncultured Desulfovibrio sp. TaxID=167968 RepID=UPI0003A4FAE4|nr:isochorismate lyase [uncultured Desulfovibrio sp.]